MQNFKIVTDSSSDIHSFPDVAYSCAPLKIITDNREYTDNKELDVAQMISDLANYKGRSSTSCPNTNDWLNTFGNSKNIFCITISAELSGSYNSAVMAKEIYEEQHPNRKVFVINSRSTGGEMRLIVQKLSELISQNLEFDDICSQITEYTEHTGLVFMLQSMKNLANNGRVSHLVAKAAGLLGIRVLGCASDIGTLQMLDKFRGEEKSLHGILSHLKELGFSGGKVEISHCQNPDFAEKVKDAIQKGFKTAKTNITACGGLCSFYAEKGGIIIGFEKI